jgi:hypothetical protein
VTEGVPAKGLLHRLQFSASAKLTKPQDEHLVRFIQSTKIRGDEA